MDGKGLTESFKCPSAHRCVDDGSSLLSGRDYIKCIHVRYGTLYKRSMCARGRDRKDKSCRRGCGQVETLNHIIQGCYATHFARIKRNDAIVNYVQKIVQDRGITDHKEPHFKIDNSTLKPDLVLYTTDRVHALDIQIVNDQFSLQQAHTNKCNKYRQLHSQLNGLRPGGFRCDTLTLNWRDVVAEASYKELTAFQILRKGDFKIISTRALIGAIYSHRCHQHMTASFGAEKQGVG